MNKGDTETSKDSIYFDVLFYKLCLRRGNLTQTGITCVAVMFPRNLQFYFLLNAKVCNIVQASF